MDEYVFPQDRKDGQAGLAREGGLTKRELFAALIYASRQDLGINAAIERADLLVKGLSK